MSTSPLLPTILDFPTVVKSAPFKRLKMKHRRVIALHIQSLKNSEIAALLNVSASYVSTVLNNPAVQPILESIYKDYEKELKALFPLTVNALRDGLEHGEMGERLRATELWHKIHGTFQNVDEARVTAEDVIERIMEQVAPDGSKLRYTERRFLHNTGDGDAKTIDVTSSD